MAEAYEIVIEGHLDGRWMEWMAGLTFTHLPDGKTLLSGLLVDQTALFGLLDRIRDLNLTLISVNRCSTPKA